MKKPRHYLENQTWLQRIDSSLVGSATLLDLQNVDLERADVLLPLILKRLEKHVAAKVPPGRQKHWCLEWVRINLPVLCAIATRKGHIKKSNFLGDTEYTCLLTTQIHNFHEVLGRYELYEGCYLYVFKNGEDLEIVRSGKVASGHTKRNFAGRDKEHGDDAMLEKKSTHSKFHLTYPQKQASFLPKSLRGHFDDLTQYVGLAFDPDNSDAVDAICNTSEDGIFEWPEEMLTHLKADSWNAISLKKKQLNMVSFLWELFYDLALAPGSNVSQSPGFERYLLDFKSPGVGDMDVEGEDADI